jgi:hypothetical protein
MVRTRSDLGCPLVASTFSLHVDEPWNISQDNPAFEEGVDESIAGDAGDVVAIVEDAMQRLFDLEADWDGEGSPVFDEITVKAASDFVYELSFQGNGESLTKEVEILPASGGSVDLHWQTPHFGLFDLEADWDGEGSPVFDEITVKAASDFVYELSFQGNGESLTKEVEILPASGGSVDLHWQTPHFELLIVFNADGSSSFYGDNCNGERSIQGEQRPDPEEIAHWMGGLDA